MELKPDYLSLKIYTPAWYKLDHYGIETVPLLKSSNTLILV